LPLHPVARPGFILILLGTVLLVSVYLVTGGGDVEGFLNLVAPSTVAAIERGTWDAPPPRPDGYNGPILSHQEAQKFFDAADGKGDTYAQFRVGVIYEYGLGGYPQDIAASARYYRMAADKGSWKAQTNLAIMLESGRSPVAHDAAEALRLYRLAAAQDDTYAEDGLGRMYHTGNGVARVDVEALKHFKIAAARGIPQRNTSWRGRCARIGAACPRTRPKPAAR
jgi:TPR repeat protein